MRQEGLTCPAAVEFADGEMWVAPAMAALPASGEAQRLAEMYRRKGLDAVLKKVGEEATEVVMAAKDGQADRVTAEVADLWFHTMIALAHYGLTPADVVAELERREGTSGIEEKAMRKALKREEQA